MKKLLFGALLVTLAAATPARAQSGGVYADRPVHLNIGGGFTVPMSDVSDRFGTGGGFNIGMIVEPKPARRHPVRIRVQQPRRRRQARFRLAATPVAALADQRDYRIPPLHALPELERHLFDRSRVDVQRLRGGWRRHVLPNVEPDVARRRLHHVLRSLLVRLLPDVDFDRPGHWRSLVDWDPGVNFGGGVTFALGAEAVFYVETRWHYMWGPEFTDGDGVVRNANGQYLPVTFGFRF